MDSAVCSFVLASFRLQNNSRFSAILPLFQIDSADFHLKTEVVFAFRKIFGLDLDSVKSVVLFQDELMQAPDDFGKNFELVLVDHHELNDKIGNKFADIPRISLIIDHRERNVKYLQKLEKCEIMIEHVGSCATLLAQKICENLGEIDEKLRIFLLSAIMMDTAMLKKRKTTKKDVEIAGKLHKLCCTNKEELKSLFREIIKAKSNVENFTLLELLKKDLKEVPNALPKTGMSTVPIPIEDFARIMNREEMNNFCCKVRELGILIILTACSKKNGGFRNLVIYSPNGNHCNSVGVFLKAQGLLNLIHEIGYDDGEFLLAFKIGKCRKICRKQILHLLSGQRFDCPL